MGSCSIELPISNPRFLEVSLVGSLSLRFASSRDEKSPSGERAAQKMKSICEQLTQETATAHAAGQSAVAALDTEMCPLCNTCVAVRYVCRVVAGAVFEGVPLDATLTPYTRPP